MDVGTRIKELRTAKGFTVNHLANLAGVSQSYLRDLELGNKNPTIEMVSSLCWALDISLRDFFDEEIQNSFLDSPLLKAVYHLSEPQRKALEAFLETL